MKKPKRAIVAALEREFGPGSDKLIAVLKKIALGEAFERPGPIPGTVKTEYPSISEMREAAMDLLAYQHGRPRQGVDIEVDDRRAKWNPDALTLTELQEMDRLARKASAPALPSGQVVDATFTTQTEKVKP
jgi:hypothetical protein